jgi:hypothetical protein
MLRKSVINLLLVASHCKVASISIFSPPIVTDSMCHMSILINYLEVCWIFGVLFDLS